MPSIPAEIGSSRSSSAQAALKLEYTFEDIHPDPDSPPVSAPLTPAESEFPLYSDYAKDPNLWFEDGNVILVAEESLFRVHRGVLSRHSPVFRDMFAVPQPAAGVDASDTVDGCPTVNVSDSTHDLKQLLLVIYDGFEYLKPGEPVPFTALAALARLAHKYQVEGVLAESIRRLQTTFTTSFEIWDKHYGGSNAVVDMAHGDPVEAVNLFRQIGRPDMLPTAMYLCCQLRARDLLRGVKRADGTLEKLSLEDVELCWDLRHALAQREAHYKSALFHTAVGSGCASSAECRERLREAHDDYSRRYTIMLGCDPLRGFVRRKMCAVCAGMLETRDRQLRRDVWIELPRLAGLDDHVEGWEQ